MIDTIPPISPSTHRPANALLALIPSYKHPPFSLISLIFPITNIHNVQQEHPLVLLDSKAWPRNHRRRLL